MKKLLSIIVLILCSALSVFAIVIAASLIFGLIQTIYDSSRALFWIVIFFGGSFGLWIFWIIIPLAADLSVRASQKISLSKKGLRYTIVGILIIVLYVLNLLGLIVNQNAHNLASAILTTVLLVFYSITLIMHGRETAQLEYVAPIETKASVVEQSNQIRETAINNSAKDIPTESLKALKELHEEGIISDEEFTEKKKQLLKL